MEYRFDKVIPNLNDTINRLGVSKDERLIKIAHGIPDILIKVGLPDRPLYLPESKIARGLTEGDSYNHGHKNEVGKKTVKRAIPHLGDPLAISYTELNEFGIYLTDMSSNGKPLYAYIRYDKNRDINILLSIYGRIATDAEKFVYIDDTKFRAKWDIKSYLVKKFKNRLEDEVYKGSCCTKSSIRKGER